MEDHECLPCPTCGHVPEIELDTEKYALDWDHRIRAELFYRDFGLERRRQM